MPEAAIPYDHMGSEMKHHHREPRDYGYGQADCPIQKATEVKGHSVRAMYYYTAVTDLYRLSNESDAEVMEAQTALDRLWRDLVDKKMYITGGIGSVSQWEGFGPPYVLPDLECEGCYSGDVRDVRLDQLVSAAAAHQLGCRVR